LLLVSRARRPELAGKSRRRFGGGRRVHRDLTLNAGKLLRMLAGPVVVAAGGVVVPATSGALQIKLTLVEYENVG